MDLAVDQGSPRAGRSLIPRWAEFRLVPITNLAESAGELAKRQCGRIATGRGRLEAVYGRWWPYQGSWWDVYRDRWFRSGVQDVCELYYHAPRSSPNFLTLDYVRSGPRTSLTTFYAATLMLDEIARLRQSDAIVCHVTNPRISSRLLERWGWQQHCHQWSGRHFIKRFYGDYPLLPEFWRERLNFRNGTRSHQDGNL